MTPGLLIGTGRGRLVVIVLVPAVLAPGRRRPDAGILLQPLGLVAGPELGLDAVGRAVPLRRVLYRLGPDGLGLAEGPPLIRRDGPTRVDAVRLPGRGVRLGVDLPVRADGVAGPVHAN